MLLRYFACNHTFCVLMLHVRSQAKRLTRRSTNMVRNVCKKKPDLELWVRIPSVMNFIYIYIHSSPCAASLLVNHLEWNWFLHSKYLLIDVYYIAKCSFGVVLKYRVSYTRLKPRHHWFVWHCTESQRPYLNKTENFSKCSIFKLPYTQTDTFLTLILLLSAFSQNGYI